MNLVIVESPNKIKAISKILGDDYTVLATAGHIRLIKPEFAYKTGIDIQHDFKISFEFDSSKNEFRRSKLPQKPPRKFMCVPMEIVKEKALLMK